MNKKSIFAAVLLFVLTIYLSCTAVFAAPNLNKSKLSLYVGQSADLKVNGTAKKVTWSSGRSNIASVTPSGKVTAKKVGTAVIRAKVSGVTLTCTVTVKASSIKLNKTGMTLYISGTKTFQLKATIKGANSKVTWKSSNTSVAAVGPKGKVTAKKAGKAIITAKANGKTAKCTVTVKDTSELLDFNSYKRITPEKPLILGGTMYFMEYNGFGYAIYAAGIGYRKQLISQNAGYVALTNGTYVYYAYGTRGSSTYSIRRYAINTGKDEFILSGDRYYPVYCDGSYLYYGSGLAYGGVVSPLEVFNLKTKKVISTPHPADTIYVVNGKLLVADFGSPHYGILFLMNKDGSNVKDISEYEVCDVKVLGKYIYYREADLYAVPYRKYRTCRCDLNGNNKKIIENWTSSPDPKYF